MSGANVAKKKKLKGWKKVAAIAGGAALGAVNPFKVVKAAKKVYKVAKYTKKALSSTKKLKAARKAVKKAKITKTKKIKYKGKTVTVKTKKQGKTSAKAKKTVALNKDQSKRNLATAASKNTSNDSVNVLNNTNKRLYRVMSEDELKAVLETEALRGGRNGRTFFTDSYYRSADNAKARLSLPEKPSYIMGFEIVNKPNICGGTRVKLQYGEKGGGREYFTDDIVKVKIINYQRLR